MARDEKGFGDDQGTRVGKPDRPQRAGNEGQGGSLGMGAEAAEGIHGARGGRDPEDLSSVEGTPTGRGASHGADDRAGSEPLVGREQEHRSSYGGGSRPEDAADTTGRGSPSLSETPANSRNAGDGTRRPRAQQEEDI